jgi:hypothetical protein
MMDRARKREIYHRLKRCGLQTLAQNIMTTLRKEWRAEKAASGFGMERRDPEIAALAWIEVWRQLEPLCEVLEKLKQQNKDLQEKLTKVAKEAAEAKKEAKAKPANTPEPKPEPSKPQPKPEPVFVGYQGDPDDLVDPDYNQADDAIRTKDAYAWLEQNFRRVVRDTKKGTTINFGRANTKPPTVFAIQLLEEYARAAPGTPQRRALSDKIQQVLGKITPTKSPKRSGIGYAGNL